jgi:hypothetical protein
MKNMHNRFNIWRKEKLPMVKRDAIIFREAIQNGSDEDFELMSYLCWCKDYNDKLREYNRRGSNLSKFNQNRLYDELLDIAFYKKYSYLLLTRKQKRELVIEWIIE